MTVLSFCDFGDSKGSGSEWSAGGIALRRCRGQKKPMGNFCSRTISSKESAEEIVIAAKWSLQSRDLACPQAGESPRIYNNNPSVICFANATSLYTREAFSPHL